MAEKPRVYFLHGNDQVAIEHFIDEIIRRMGDPGTAELNTSRLEGRQTNLNGVRSAAYALPFLTDRRLVIVTNPLSMAGGAENQKKFVELLNGLPGSTALVLVIADEMERGRWNVLGKHAWLKDWQADHKNLGFWQEYVQPSGQAMPGWILKQTQKMGGEITPEGAQALAAHTNSDTSLAVNEIEKLITYTNKTRPIRAEDVELLVAPGGAVDIFEMIDRMSSGQAAVALRLLDRLLEQTTPREVFAMAVQFRLLIQVRDLLDEGGPGQVFTEMAKTAYLNKYIQQAERFTIASLEAIYHRLVEMDEAMKISQLTPELALEMLITELAK
jgi:DNA polymerase-3 subunit delta